MDHEVEFAPLLLDLVEGGVDAGGVGDVTRHDDFAADRLGKRPKSLLERFTLEGEGELGAVIVAGLGDPPGDRAFVGDAHDEAFFTGH